MTEYDPYDDRAARSEAAAIASRERTAHRLGLLLDRRPAAFAEPGELRPDIAQWTRGYLAGDRGSLILIGEIGTGKSWSLWKIAETLVRTGWTGRFELAPAYDVKAATDWPVDAVQVRSWRNADLFAIDDLGAHRVNDWDVDALSGLIDSRWQHKRPTLIASNETDLKAIVGARAASRLAGGATIARFKGADLRRSNS